MKFLLILLLVSSCATAKRKFEIVDVPFIKQKWRICEKEKDGAIKHLNGFCYISQECRKRFILSPKCRPLPLYCSFKNNKCIQRLLDAGKVLHTR